MIRAAASSTARRSLTATPVAGGPAAGAARRLLDALGPHLRAYGITRVGDLTGLDVIEIPVAFAARPNSRSLAVSQGKSLDPVEARLGAVMEALEQALAERAEDLAVERDTAAALRHLGKACVNLKRISRVGRAPDDDDILTWVSANSLVTGAEVLLPFELVGLDLRADAGWNISDFQVSSVGLAAGASWEAAAVHGLLEVLEHNATAALDIMGLRPPFARPVRYRVGACARLDAIVSRIDGAGPTYRLFDLSNVGGLPVVAALVGSPDTAPDSAVPCAGFACRFSPERAAEAALLEAVQSRLTLISGARDDLTVRSYAHRALREAEPTRDAPTLDELSRDAAEMQGRHPAEQLACAIDAALKLGADDIFLSHIGRVDDLVAVVRIVVDGLEASGLNATAILGQRTLTALFAGL